MEPQCGKWSRNCLPSPCWARALSFSPASQQGAWNKLRGAKSQQAPQSRGEQGQGRLCWCFVCLCAATLLFVFPRAQPELILDDPCGTLPAQDSLSHKSWGRSQLLEGSGWTFSMLCAVLQLPLFPFLWTAVESKSLRAGRRNSSTKPRTAQDPAGTVISGDRCAHGVLKAEQELQYYFIPVDMQIFVHQTPLFRVLPWVLCSYSLKKQENIGFQGNIRALQSKWSIFESQTWTWWSKTRKGPQTNNPQSKKEHYQSPYIFK